MDFNTFSQKELPCLEEFLVEELQKNMTNEERLEEAMRYSIEAGGKRLRPLLLLLVLESFSAPVEKGKHIAAALEFIHTYSLIHDDLPAMDDDELRRGKPTNHIVYGEATAILAGDALLTKAFELATLGPASAEEKITLVRELAKAAGHTGMVGGQQTDLDGESRALTLEELQSVHARKTGALLEFAVFAGGFLSGVDEHALALLDTVAKRIGVAYQIRDDLLDVIGDAEELGKNIGMDVKQNKSTYPSLLTLAGAQEALQQELDTAYRTVNELDEYCNKIGQPYDKQLLQTFIDQLKLEGRVSK
ncbi:polyprenyl synthetase family protein [Atopococcus tabaci]|uniref:polyprenyl synthetase family protein n=1 Tax=Atopococcus tabaci TaxID=269774 RepID=UPI0003FF63F8|nr:farnesyl diphosphate synthase [Atopococcus tabaci]